MPTSFYGRLRAAEYDIGTDNHVSLNFYLDRWRRLGSPGPALEPMCGTGLNLIPFAEAGAEIDGLDSSPHMLAECRRKLDAQGLSAHLYEQPLEQMALPRRYGFIFIPDRSFAHIHDKALAQACLQRLWDHVLPGGCLMLDVLSPAHRKDFPQAGHSAMNIHDRPDGSTVLVTEVWNAFDEDRVIRCWNKYERFVDGRLAETEVFDYWERIYERVEFEALLTAVGVASFEVTATYEDREPHGDDSFVFICRKA